jgi:hypothetical protein
MTTRHINNTTTRLKAFCYDPSLHIIWPTPVSAARLDNLIAANKSIFCHANLQITLETFCHTQQASKHSQSNGAQTALTEFRAMVGDNHAGLAPPLEERRQFASNTTAGDRGVRDRRQAFARYVINDVEHAKSSSAGELIVHEIQRPTGIGLGFDEYRRTRSDGTPPGLPLANRQAFLSV